MRANVGSFAAVLGFVAVVGAFHTPYRPEQSRHYDVTKTDSFHPITEKVRVAGDAGTVCGAWSSGIHCPLRMCESALPLAVVLVCCGLSQRVTAPVRRFSTCTMPTAHTFVVSMAWTKSG
jgi:hypothetical protein